MARVEKSETVTSTDTVILKQKLTNELIQNSRYTITSNKLRSFLGIGLTLGAAGAAYYWVGPEIITAQLQLGWNAFSNSVKDQLTYNTFVEGLKVGGDVGIEGFKNFGKIIGTGAAIGGAFTYITTPVTVKEEFKFENELNPGEKLNTSIEGTTTVVASENSSSDSDDDLIFKNMPKKPMAFSHTLTQHTREGGDIKANAAAVSNIVQDSVESKKKGLGLR